MQKELYKLILVFIMISFSFALAFFIGREVTLEEQQKAKILPLSRAPSPPAETQLSPPPPKRPAPTRTWPAVKPTLPEKKPPAWPEETKTASQPKLTPPPATRPTETHTKKNPRRLLRLVYLPPQQQRSGRG